MNAGATILRINEAHSTNDAIAEFVSSLRDICGDRVRMIVDLPTNKIRTWNLDDPMPSDQGERFSLEPLPLNYPKLHEIAHVLLGDRVKSRSRVKVA